MTACNLWWMQKGASFPKHKYFQNLEVLKDAFWGAIFSDAWLKGLQVIVIYYFCWWLCHYCLLASHKRLLPTGQLVPVFKTSKTENVRTGVLKHFRLDYCFGPSHHYNISITTVADDQKSGFASYACKKTYNNGTCNVNTPYRDISGGSANFIEVGLDGPQDYGPVQVIVRGDGRFGDYNNFTIAASVPYWLRRPATVKISCLCSFSSRSTFSVCKVKAPLF